ncbi:hypothetical protein [Enemella sp. A6]|uniref:hypothetical protein n=1 Tax=Enemella sp. A6 TaxID=3440152 RepID=UPI003EBE0222
MKVKDAVEVQTAPLVAAGMIGGYLAARETGVRPLGGVLLGAAGVWSWRTWMEKGGIVKAGILALLYLAGFGLSHPLAKKVGAWPAVLGVTAVSAGAAHLMIDRED